MRGDVWGLVSGVGGRVERILGSIFDTIFGRVSSGLTRLSWSSTDNRSFSSFNLTILAMIIPQYQVQEKPLRSDLYLLFSARMSRSWAFISRHRRSSTAT